MQDQKITKESNIAKVIKDYPQVIEVLLDWGLHCVGCSASVVDTIEAGAKVHGLSDEEITELVERINEVIEYKE